MNELNLVSSSVFYLLYCTLVKDNMLIGWHGYWLNLLQHSHMVDAQGSKVTNRILGCPTLRSSTIIVVTTLLFYAVYYILSTCQTLSEKQMSNVDYVAFAEFDCVCMHVITPRR